MEAIEGQGGSSRIRRAIRAAVPAAAALLAAGCATAGPELVPAPTAVFFTGAGDIADCGTPGAAATAALLDRIPGAVWTSGDNAYPAGSIGDYARCFHPTWGRHRERIRPTPGNHDYWSPAALPYFAYFGAAAGEPGEGWYSYEYGGWLVVALNSNLEIGPDSEQVRWLRSLLERSDHACTVAYFHHPLVSSSSRAAEPDVFYSANVRPLWAALHAAGAELILVGHDHHYERFAPLTPQERRDRSGIRQFIVGTGGGVLRGHPESLHPASEHIETGHYGVLKLELDDGAYGWEFVAADGRVLDRGSDRCH